MFFENSQVLQESVEKMLTVEMGYGIIFVQGEVA